VITSPYDSPDMNLAISSGDCYLLSTLPKEQLPFDTIRFINTTSRELQTSGSLSEVRLVQVRPGEIRPSEVRLARVRRGRVCLRDFRPAEPPPNPSCGGVTGKASFGFVSNRGASERAGQTQFQFKVGNLNFHSSSYDWLVVAGAKAMFKGTGTINGAGNYGFMVSAVDGQITGGGGVDKFRIKIWDKDAGDLVVYDNQMDAAEDAEPTTVPGGGSIVIHKEE